MHMTSASAEQGFGALKFRFVVIADTHLNAVDGASSSPFAVNARANERAQAVFEHVNRWQPAFVVHVGDIVHPVPELASFAPACERFKALARMIEAPLHLVPGNHDVGDKPVQWMPAGTVTQENVERYRQIFGPDFYSFDASGVHCVVIDAQIVNSGLPAEAEQRAWLEQDLARHGGSRMFFFIHYPPYVSERGEAGNYDNLDEPGRTWLLELLQRYRPEALFAGHVHNQWYDIFEHTELYILPSTAFVRQDYAELFRVPPLAEFGRDDWTKLGYYVVDVYASGHVAHFIRSNGALRLAELGPRSAPISPVHTKTNVAAPIGVDMRHAWIEWLDVAATGGVQEFARKRTRNDYPALALWEMGIRRLRVPLQDLADARVRARMSLLRRLGHRYTAYVFGLPAAEMAEALHSHAELIDALEVVVPWEQAPALLPALAHLRAQSGIRIWLSKLRRHEDAKFDGSHYNHFINHGFVPAEHEQLREMLAQPGARTGVDGFVGRVGQGRCAWSELNAWEQLAVALDIRMAVHVRIAADNPAEPIEDDLAIANRVAQALLAASCCSRLEVFLDSFCDVDRNYFPHHGLVDRRYDPRLAARVITNMHGALRACDAQLQPIDAGGCDRFEWALAGTARERLLLLTFAASAVGGEFELPLAVGDGRIDVIDLGRGARLASAVAAGRLALPPEVRVEAPLLLRIDR
ncbi:MAG: metallophosphoesterase [Burkholderiales bacterium]|nr:metallophosphoesterase [Burkholderiales bacterium]